MPGDRDAAMIELAMSAHAIVDVPDLSSLGIDASATQRRVKRGRLFRLHQGVYSIIPPAMLKPEGWWLAATRAAGPNAGIAWPHAGALWELVQAPGRPIHVAVAGNGGRRRRSGLIIHRRPALTPADFTVRNGIWVTSARQTLLDAQRALPSSRFDSLLRKAEKLQLDTGRFYAIEDVDLNEFERRLLALCRRHSLPRPLTQQVIGPYTVDFLWPDAKLVVETDGWENHGTRAGFESDRARDAWLVAQGYRVIRFTWRQLRDDPAMVVATLRAIVAAPR